MPVSDKNQRISVTLSRELLAQIRQLAEAEHRSISSQIAYELSKVLAERTLREGAAGGDEPDAGENEP